MPPSDYITKGDTMNAEIANYKLYDVLPLFKLSQKIRVVTAIYNEDCIQSGDQVVYEGSALDATLFFKKRDERFFKLLSLSGSNDTVCIRIMKDW